MATGPPDPGRFEMSLLKYKTAPILIQVIKSHYIRWLYQELPEILHPPPPPEYFNAVEDQQRIGINQLLRGRLSIKWRLYQYEYYHQQCGEQQSKIPIKVNNWARHMIRSLWTLSMELWKIRNDQLHHSQENHTATKTKWLQERV